MKYRSTENLIIWPQLSGESGVRLEVFKFQDEDNGCREYFWCKLISV
jgi:hypothetical protein